VKPDLSLQRAASGCRWTPTPRLDVDLYLPALLAGVTGSRPVTAERALLFGRVFGQTPQYWLNLQADYDLKRAERDFDRRLKAVVELASG
jgi:hypothetical protein